MDSQRAQEYEPAPVNSPVSPSGKRRALVTGASRGIGAAVAARLARDGLSVIINFRSNENAAIAVKALIEEQGGEAELCPFDVGDRAATASALATLLEKGPISVLVNNAGIARDAAFPAMKPEDWDAVMQTTLGGFYNVTMPLVMPMVRQRFGRIISMSSVSAIRGNRGQVNYAAAKAGIVGATKSLSIELAKRNITVNAVAPGLIETDMVQEVRPEVIEHAIPAKRMGRPDEVAGLVSYLARDEAAYVTGQVIGIDGGMS